MDFWAVLLGVILIFGAGFLTGVVVAAWEQVKIDRDRERLLRRWRRTYGW